MTRLSDQPRHRHPLHNPTAPSYLAGLHITAVFLRFSRRSKRNHLGVVSTADILPGHPTVFAFGAHCLRQEPTSHSAVRLRKLGRQLRGRVSTRIFDLLLRQVLCAKQIRTAQINTPQIGTPKISTPQISIGQIHTRKVRTG